MRKHTLSRSNYRNYKMTQVDIYNFYEFVTQEFDETKGRLVLRWDRNNTELRDLMINEEIHLYDKSAFINLSYVDYIKEHTNWEEGQTIYYKTISNYFIRSKLVFEVITNPFEDEYTFVEINSDGYLYLREFRGTCMSNKSESQFASHKINCFYNECADSRNRPYILK